VFFVEVYQGSHVINLNSPTSVRVVIVEDDTATRAALVNVLQTSIGYTIAAEFADGQSAIRSLTQTLPDLMLVDLGLPDMPGTKVIETAVRVLPDCDVLVISTFGDEQSVFSALAAGARGYLLKGGTDEELRKDIASLRQGGSPLSPAVARKVLTELSTRMSPKHPPETDENNVQAQYTLSEREVQILKLIGRGYSYEETAQYCSITRDTVHAHLKHIYRKLNVHSKTQALFSAREKNIIS
jgi:DNA-binding NarL/FixJ family response regulator